LEKEKRTLKEFALKHTFAFGLMVLLLMILLLVIRNSIEKAMGIEPSYGEYQEEITRFSTVIREWIPGLFLLWLMRKWEFFQKTNVKYLFCGMLLGIPVILDIMLNLLPLCLIPSSLFRVQWITAGTVFLACIGIGLYEEVLFRGILMQLLWEKWSGKKYCAIKSAVVNSLLFAVMHLLWLISFYIYYGTIPAAEILRRCHQVYYTFCFGMLASAVTMYSKSILPMVIWHGCNDLSAFISVGILPIESFQHYFVNRGISWTTFFIKMGILRKPWQQWSFSIIVNMISLIVGILIILRVQKANHKALDAGAQQPL